MPDRSSATVRGGATAANDGVGMSGTAIQTSLVVPCFNEARRLDGLLAAIDAWRHRPAARNSDPPEADVVLVDDGSTDETPARLARAAKEDESVHVVSLSPNEGKGSALRAGIAAARGAYVVALDADLAVGLTHLDAIVGALETGADLAIGSRNAPGGRITHPQPALRRWLGRGYLALSRRWLSLDVADVTCGFKGFRRDVARDLFAASRCRRWGIDAEVLSLARRRGYAITEVPVTWCDGRASSVRLARDVAGSLVELIEVRRRAGRDT
jgi:glycosyltransferase involved in cell wall biosynthesis